MDDDEFINVYYKIINRQNILIDNDELLKQLEDSLPRHAYIDNAFIGGLSLLDNDVAQLYVLYNDKEDYKEEFETFETIVYDYDKNLQYVCKFKKLYMEK